MGRSVNYLNNAEYVLYFPTPESNGEDGEYDEFIAQLNWDDMLYELKATIKKRLKSYYDSDKWDGRETKVILENNLCIIGLSEYCGLCSLSIAVKEVDTGWGEKVYHEQFAKRHAHQVRETLEKIISDIGLTRLNKLGSMSNGEGVYEKANT